MAFNIDDWNDKILRRERKNAKKHNFQTLASAEHDNTFTRDLLIFFYVSSWQLNMLNYEIWMIAPDLANLFVMQWLILYLEKLRYLHTTRRDEN